LVSLGPAIPSEVPPLPEPGAQAIDRSCRRQACSANSPAETPIELGLVGTELFCDEGSEMLGWHISVYKQKDGGESPAVFATSEGTRLAVWQTGIGGLDWLSELVKAGKAVDLGGNGYPCRYTVPAQHLMSEIADSPPMARDSWLSGAGDLITNQWEGKTVVDGDAVTICRPDEWLLVEAWDES
jgi:hypothetical protein